MNIDRTALQELVNMAVVPSVVKRFNEAGGRVIRSLTTSLHKLFDCIEESACDKEIIVFQTVQEAAPLDYTTTTITDFRELIPRVKDGFILQIHNSGQISLIKNTNIELKTLSQLAIVFHFERGIDSFIVNGEKIPLPSVYPGPYSIFSVPTFSDLKEALHYYAREQVYTSKCRVFNLCWFDEAHLFLKAKPESTMRRSLEQFLNSGLRGNAEVRPEQNVDETHPIDIRVLFRMQNRVALIEIKWMGDSKNEDGSETTSWRDQRARDGAKQLAEYLDEYKQTDPNTNTIGFLVVIDARRNNSKISNGMLSVEDALYYENREITFTPEYHKIREDFEEPLRMFSKPIVASGG